MVVLIPRALAVTMTMTPGLRPAVPQLLSLALAQLLHFISIRTRIPAAVATTFIATCMPTHTLAAPTAAYPPVRMPIYPHSVSIGGSEE